MAHRFYHYITLPLCLIMLLSPFVHMYPSTRNQLDYNFYDESCPHLSMVVRFNIWEALENDARMAASLLRLHFHDCFVNGCDGSVLLDDTEDFVGEKNAFPRRNSLRGFEIIDDIKTDVEKFCPSTVSCVDILTLAARDAILLSGGPFWPVLLGRRDGTSASQKAANEQLPSTIEPLDKMIDKFTSKGLDIKDVVALSALNNDTRMAASLLRLHFHDCIVNGCDGSVLLDDTEDFKGEKNAFPNRNSLRGFEVIDNIKADVEKFCPSTVSCVDILTLAAREAILLSGGPFWPVLLGRRDGTTASQKAANEQIPSPIEPLDNIITKFTSKGLDIKDVVALSGGHTIGFAQCFTFKRRLFDFQGSGQPDPALDSSFLTNLQTMCPNKDQSNGNLAPLDSLSSFKFDNGYYTSLMNNTGLLESDQALIGDPRTASIVKSYTTNPYLFSNDFAASMIKLGNVGILIAPNGQIRKKCGSVN